MVYQGSVFSHLFSGGVEVQSQLQSLLSLFGADGELFPDSVESRQSVSGRARRTAQRLAEDDGRLQQLTAVIVGALQEKPRGKTTREMGVIVSLSFFCFQNDFIPFFFFCLSKLMALNV